MTMIRTLSHTTFSSAQTPARSVASAAAKLMLLVIGCLALAGCDSEEKQRLADEKAGLIEPLEFDWTAPQGDSFDVAMKAWDEASASKSGNHPGWVFAENIIRPLAEKDDPAALHHLGILHFVGNGGADFNHHQAAQYIKAAAAQNYPPAHGFIGFQTETGDGVMFLKSDEKALESYRQAADGGHCGSIKRLVRAYTNGELGLTADPQKASALEAKIPNCMRR